MRVSWSNWALAAARAASACRRPCSRAARLWALLEELIELMSVFIVAVGVEDGTEVLVLDLVLRFGFSMMVDAVPTGSRCADVGGVGMGYLCSELGGVGSLKFSMLMLAECLPSKFRFWVTPTSSAGSRTIASHALVLVGDEVGTS